MENTFNREARYAAFLFSIGLLFFNHSLAHAQSNQFWPEIDTYVKLDSNVRFFLVTSVTREDRVGTSGEIGANIDFFLKPVLKLKRVAGFQLDESKSRPLTVRLGYRYLPSFDGPNEQRIVLEATGRFPTKAGVLFSNRNRIDFRFIEDADFSWRYRNRITTERNFNIGRIRTTPYARVEVYYDSRYSKWSNTSVSAGSIFPIGARMDLEGYYEHQNNTGTSPNQQVNAVGFVVSLYF